jgi:two-component system sensor histidine kinase KdpD
MLFITQVISHLTIISRRQASLAHLAEQRTATLHSLSRQLAGTRGFNQLLEVAVRYLAHVFDSEIMVLFPENNHLTIHTTYRTKPELTDKEMSVAQWVYDVGQIAGLGTDTLPFSDAVYVPLLTSQKPLGVIRLRPEQADRLLISEQMHLLEACVTQITLALEVEKKHST